MKIRKTYSITKIITIVMFCVMLCQPTVFAAETITVTVDGSKIQFDQSPIIENGRTLVPLRAIFEKLNAIVEWDDATQTVYAKRHGT